MKKLFFVALFFLTLKGFSQDMNSLKTRASKTVEASSKMDFKTILDLTYPKLFTIASREDMMKVLEQTFNGNEQFKIKMLPVAPNFVFGDIKKIENHTFCIIKHNNAIEMSFTAKVEDPTMYIEAFKSSMNNADVTFDQEKNAFTVKMISTIIAVADETTKNEWTFLNNDNSKELFAMLFNENIKKELGL